MPQHHSKIKFIVGNKIDVLDNNNWYTARILQLEESENKVLIHFQGWNDRYDKWFEMNSEELRQNRQDKKLQDSIVGKKKKPEDFKVGQYVLAKWIDCRRYPAKIQQVNSDKSYQVLFDDGVSMNVQAINVKAMDSNTRKQYARKIPTKSKRNGKTIYKCPECSKAFRKQALVDSHVKHLHSTTEQKKLKMNTSGCPEFSIDYNTESSTKTNFTDKNINCTESEQEEDYEEEVVNCVCLDNEENDLIVQCDSCFCWQHQACLDQQDIPATYYCWVCLKSPKVRESQKYAYDQEWLKKGNFPSLITPSKILANLRVATNDLSSNLISFEGAMLSAERRLSWLRNVEKDDLNNKIQMKSDNLAIKMEIEDKLDDVFISNKFQTNGIQSEDYFHNDLVNTKPEILKELMDDADTMEEQLDIFEKTLIELEKETLLNSKFNVNLQNEPTNLLKILKKNLIDFGTLKKLSAVCSSGKHM